MLGSLRLLSDSPDSHALAPACVLSDSLHAYLMGRADVGDFSGLNAHLAANGKHESGSDEVSGTSGAFASVVATASTAVGGVYTGFPGPMCSPFRRSHASMLKGQPYTFTEKSDGLRVLAVTVRVDRFPRWSLADGTAERGEPWLGTLDHLSVIARLEEAATSLTAVDSALQVTLPGHGLAEVTRLDEDGTQFCVTFEGQRALLHRSAGPRQLALCFDRSMDAAYLLLHSPVTPFSAACEEVVVDGELMLAYDSAEECSRHSGQAPGAVAAGHSGRLVFGLFDLLSYRTSGEALTRLTNETMPDRYKMLLSLAGADLPSTAQPASGDATSRVAWFVKDMPPLTRLSQCLAERISLCGDVYCYRGPCGYTQNDGFIFTPDRFAICGGASATQVKWKWLSLLSVDWLVSASETSASEYNVWLFFRKKTHGHGDDITGHWKCHHPMTLLNPHGFDIPVDSRVVAECVYNGSARRWSIARLRHDKTAANSIVTVVSVFESVAESVTLRLLLDLLLDTVATDAPTARLLDALEPSAAPAVAPLLAPVSSERRMYTKLGLRAVMEPAGGTKLMLTWMTNRGNPEVKRGIPCQLCLVRACRGLSLPASSRAWGDSAPTDLENYLYIQLANAGGTLAWSDYVVDAYFDGEAGEWVIARLYPRGRNTDTNFDSLLLHLNWVLENGGGNAAGKALPSDFLIALAVVPRSSVAETKLTNEHYSHKANELGSSRAHAGKEDKVPVRGLLHLFNNWIKAMALAEAETRLTDLLTREESRAASKLAGQTHDLQARFRGRGGGRGCRGGRGGGGRGRGGGGVAGVDAGTPARRPLLVADICCGRGGDLYKWRVMGPSFLFMTDSSFECVAEAAARYSTTKGLSTKERDSSGVPALFTVHDVFDPDSRLKKSLLDVVDKQGHRFHLASCQFSMHYGCFSEERLGYFLDCIAAALCWDGGLFVGTTVSDDALVSRFKQHGPEFGTASYHVRFPEESAAVIRSFVQPTEDGAAPAALPFGLKYYTSVEQAVTELPEFVVPWPRLVDLALERGLHVVLDQPFCDFADARVGTEVGQQLLDAITAGGKRARSEDEAEAGAETRAFALTPDQREAVSVYRVFMLELRRTDAA